MEQKAPDKTEGRSRILGIQYGSFFISPIRPQELGGGAKNFGKGKGHWYQILSATFCDAKSGRRLVYETRFIITLRRYVERI